MGEIVKSSNWGGRYRFWRETDREPDVQVGGSKSSSVCQCQCVGKRMGSDCEK